MSVAASTDRATEGSIEIKHPATPLGVIEWLRQVKVPHSARGILSAFVGFANLKDGHCYVTVAQLADICQCSPSTVKRAINVLKDARLIWRPDVQQPDGQGHWMAADTFVLYPWVTGDPWAADRGSPVTRGRGSSVTHQRVPPTETTPREENVAEDADVNIHSKEHKDIKHALMEVDGVKRYDSLTAAEHAKYGELANQLVKVGLSVMEVKQIEQCIRNDWSGSEFTVTAKSLVNNQAKYRGKHPSTFRRKKETRSKPQSFEKQDVLKDHRRSLKAQPKKQIEGLFDE